MIEILLLMALTSDPNCTAIQGEQMQWGKTGQGAVETTAVPDGEIWLVRAAGVFGDNQASEYMMELVTPVWSQGGACCWRIPLVHSYGVVAATPYVALPRPIVMRKGEKLSARGNNITSKIGVNMIYYRLPAHCIPIY